MALATDHEYYVFDHGVVQLLPRGGTNWRGEIDASDDGADLLLELGDLHRLGRGG